MSQLPLEIHTARLLLRPFRPSDATDIVAYANDPEWSRFLGDLSIPYPYTRRDAEWFIAVRLLRDSDTDRAWVLEYEGHVIGGISVQVNHVHRRASLGYGIGRAWWGKGFVTEAGAAVRDALFANIPELARFEAIADARNGRSHAVMQRLGMRHELTLRGHHLSRDGIADEVVYAIVRDEWAVLNR